MTDERLERLEERLVEERGIDEPAMAGPGVAEPGVAGPGVAEPVVAERGVEERLVERLVALRGATTVDADTSDAVISRTSELLSSLLERNGVGHDQLVSIIFTSTKELRSAFPALAARELGLGDVPLLCAGELDVVGGNPNTIRVLVHCYSTLPRGSLRHVYLHAAKHLRDDLTE
jgi:chorismate mutase